MPLTVDSVIDELGGTGAVSEALGLPDNTVSTWRGRGFIPSRRWPSIVRLAKRKGRHEITFEALARLSPGEPRRASA